MGSYSQVFGGNAIQPVQPSYLPLTFSADTTLVWPLETVANGIGVASMIDALATVPSLSIFMPPANQTGLGVATIIGNIGTNSFLVKDNAGNNITNIAASQAFIVILTDNSTAAGAWRVYQLGATTSSANAAALAGNGLQALVTQLQTTINTRYASANGAIAIADRATAIVWQGATGTLTLDTIAHLTPGWWGVVTNEGTGPLTIATSGADLINGFANVVIPPSAVPQDQFYSALIACSSSGFNTLITGAPIIIPVTGGGTGADNQFDALSNLGGSPIGISIFTAPTLNAVLALLGIIPVTFKEQTISASQALVAGSSATGFVCTAPLTLTLPLTTTLSVNYFFMVYADGGAITFTPSLTDSIDGGTAGASYMIPQGSSLMMMTDAAGNWWPFFVAVPPSITSGTVVTSGPTYNVATTDSVVVVNKTIGSVTQINLEAAPKTWRRVEIKDGKGDAATNAITVVSSGGATIDGAANYVLTFNFQCEAFVFNGTQWNVVS